MTIKLYQGARVRLRSGDIVNDIRKGPLADAGYPWEGVFKHHDITVQMSWADDGKVHHSPFPDQFDVMEMLTVPPAVEHRPAINQINRADVEHFANRINEMHNISTLTLYQQIATKSAEYPGKGTPFGLMYIALGLQEAGEVQGKVKKAFRDDGILTFKRSDEIPDNEGGVVFFEPLSPERCKQIIKEAGGLLWYLAALCNEINVTLSEVALANLEELASRTERGTLQGDGDDR